MAKRQGAPFRPGNGKPENWGFAKRGGAWAGNSPVLGERPVGKKPGGLKISGDNRKRGYKGLAFGDKKAVWERVYKGFS